MVSRFISNLLVLLLGAWMACASLAFRAGVLDWIALGSGCAVLLVVLGAFALRGRGIVQRTLDVLVAATAAWTIVAAGAFASRGVVRWLAFGEGMLFLSLSVTGLVLYEIAVSRLLRRPEPRRIEDGTFRPHMTRRTRAEVA